jgi:RNA polymerase sigma-70 factor (ECF subfamily)
MPGYFILSYKKTFMEIALVHLSKQLPQTNGTPVVVAQLYKDFHQSLLRYIRSKINSKEDGEDILHNVFVRITEKQESLSGKANLKNWLFIITRNAIIDYYRKKGTHKRVELDDDLTDTLSGEETDHATQGLGHCLAGFIGLLPEIYQPILVDSELRELKQKDLADKYNLPYSSLRSRVQRGREKIKQQLLVCCRIEHDRWGNILEASPKNNCAENSCKSCEV